MSEALERQLAIEQERADYAWRNTRTIETARQDEMRKRDAAVRALSNARTAMRNALLKLNEGDVNGAIGILCRHAGEDAENG